MASIIPPWPPSSYADPQPYDQRGACWPWGPCGPRNKIQMRFDVIGFREVGSIGALWGWVSSGGGMVSWPFPITCTSIDFINGVTIPPIPQTILTIDRPDDDGPWMMRLDYWYSVALPVINHFYAEAVYDQTNCDYGWIIPVTNSFGFTDPPDWVVVYPVRWWESNAFPYNA